jgi:acetyltransferase-like isoleucine patch superfamily enzyme
MLLSFNSGELFRQPVCMVTKFAYNWRNFLLRCFGAGIGRNVIIRPSEKITYPWNLNSADNAWVGDNVELYTLGNITIGKKRLIYLLKTLLLKMKLELQPMYSLPLELQ